MIRNATVLGLRCWIAATFAIGLSPPPGTAAQSDPGWTIEATQVDQLSEVRNFRQGLDMRLQTMCRCARLARQLDA